MPGSLLAEPYPTADQWKSLVKQFSPLAIAHKLLLAHVPYVFSEEPLKFALFRRTIADAFGVDPGSVFIVGSAMAGRSLKGNKIEKVYDPSSDIDTLIVSETLFTSYVMKSLDWVREITKPSFDKKNHPISPTIEGETSKHIHWLALHAYRGIWRPDSLPADSTARRDFFEKFSEVSLKTLGLQLSDDTVAKVNGRIARSFDDAVADLASNIAKLKRELGAEDEADASGSHSPEDDAKKK